MGMGNLERADTKAAEKSELSLGATTGFPKGGVKAKNYM